MRAIIAAILVIVGLATYGPAQDNQEPDYSKMSPKEFKKYQKEREKEMLCTPLSKTLKASPDKAKAAMINSMKQAGYRLTGDTQFQLTFSRPAQGNFAYNLGASMAGRRVDQLDEVVSVTFVPDQAGNTAVDCSCTWAERNTAGSNVQGGCLSKYSHLDILRALNEAAHSFEPAPESKGKQE